MRLTMMKLTLALLCGSLLVANRSFGEDKKETLAEKEAKQAAEEEKQEQSGEASAIGSMKKVTGKLKLGPPVGDDNPNPDVVALITADSGEIYQIKLNNPDMIGKLAAYDKKKVSLTGKFRNKDDSGVYKYLIVFGIADLPVSVQQDRPPRGHF